MQIKVRPVKGHRLEIRLAESQLLLPEQDCRSLREALMEQLQQFALHPELRWQSAREEFQRLQASLEHLEQFNDNELALLLREFDFTLLYRLAQSKQMNSLVEKIEQALGRRGVDRLKQDAEKLPLKPLWEVNERIQALLRTIERMTDEGEIRPPRMNIKQTSAVIPLADSDDAVFIRQVMKKLDHFPDKVLFAIFKQTPPRELAKLWQMMEELSQQSLLNKFDHLIPEPMRNKLRKARPDHVPPADGRKNAQLIVEVIRGLQQKKSATDNTKGSGPVPDQS